MQSSRAILHYGFFAVFWHLGRFNCIWGCSWPNQDRATELHPCCAQQSLLEGWGEGCLLSCYPIYIIHYLLTTSRTTNKSCRYNIWKGESFVCTFNVSIETCLCNFRMVSMLRVLPRLIFPDLFSGVFSVHAIDTCCGLWAQHWHWYSKH